MASPCKNDPNEVIEKVVSAKTNADKFDKFVNGLDSETVQLGSGDPTPTVRNVVRQVMADAAWAKQYIADAPEGDISLNTAAAWGGSASRTIAEHFADIVNVRDYGAVGNGSADDTDAIKAAIGTTGGKIVFFPAGTYLIQHMIRVPSNTTLIGAGMGATKIKAAASAPGKMTMFQTGGPSDQRQHIRFQDLTIDGNILARLNNDDGEEGLDWVVNDEEGRETLRGSNIIICNTVNASLVRVKSIDPARHCLDVTGAHDYGEGTTSITEGDAFSVDPNPSRNIHVVDCHFEGGADDNLTTHQSSDIIISGCISRNSRGIVVDNSCAFEIDDGSRNVILTGCIASGCYRGILIKAHKGQAAPYNIAVSNCEIWNCVIGVYVTHFDLNATAAEIFAAGGKTIEDASGAEVTPYGISPTGRNIRISNVSVYAPHSFTTHAGTVYQPYSCLLITRVSDVYVENFTANEGYYATGTEYDYLPAEPLVNIPVSISVYSVNISVSKLNIVGFATPASQTIDSYLNSAIYIGENSRYVNLSNVTIRDSRPYGIYSNASQVFFLNDIVIVSSNSTNKIAGVYCLSTTMSDLIGNIYVYGYERAVYTDNNSNGMSVSGDRIYVGKNTVAGDNHQKTVRLYNDKDGTIDNFSFQLAGVEDGSYGTIFFAQKEANSDNAVKTQLYFTDYDITCVARSLAPHDDNAIYLGSSSYRWKAVYAATATIQTSDARLKDSIEAPSEALMRAWGKVRFAVFQFKPSIEKKGPESARLHVGVIAQEVAEAFASEGLDASRYGLFCYDEWEDKYEDVKVVDVEESFDESTGVLTPEVSHVERRQTQKAGSRYGIRYEEALALECAYQRWRLDQIEARLAAMEEK